MRPPHPLLRALRYKLLPGLDLCARLDWIGVLLLLLELFATSCCLGSLTSCALTRTRAITNKRVEDNKKLESSRQMQGRRLIALQIFLYSFFLQSNPIQPISLYFFFISFFFIPLIAEQQDGRRILEYASAILLFCDQLFCDHRNKEEMADAY